MLSALGRARHGRPHARHDADGRDRSPRRSASRSAPGDAGRSRSILTVDALTALQIEKNAGLSTAELVEQVRRVGPKAAKGRRRTPRLVRRRAIPELQDVAGQKEPWTFGFLIDVILTRDPFLHRTDIAEAIGVKLDVSAEHEGVLVDDVVNEWATRHDEPYDLELTGPAGGHWQRGEARDDHDGRVGVLPRPVRPRLGSRPVGCAGSILRIAADKPGDNP